MTTITNIDLPSEGLRERKRRETTQRIADVGMRLFIEKGYEATTLDDIAAGADISRRTFFYYFKSKDDILLSMQSEMGEVLVAALQGELEGKRPLDAVRSAIIKVCAPFPAADMIAIDCIMRSSDAVQARKQATYVQQEKILFEVLRKQWPEEGRETGLRMVAMAAVGAMRLAFDTLSREGNKRPILELLNESFDALENEI
ncbi:TetR/AcrR family transcriptional regulator [Teredinibacter haidensis]|uniref:TetR/AcrR family transcriptional regulator n=1 Tax=Teredinibacter haidensis TaxID=2731755 RepID=UPI000948D900|nr:TetR/AcrR family transcriptional regulator [Teredinibacter haidensis]